LQNYKIFGAASLLEKRFSYRKSRGGAVLKFGRCLALESKDLVALETGPSDSEIANLK
jgi:hypothetical protein